MSDYLETMREQQKVLNGIAFNLQRLSEAAFAMGNENLHYKLNGYANKLFTAEETISVAVSEELRESRKAAEQNSAAILGTALAVSELKRKESGE